MKGVTSMFRRQRSTVVRFCLSIAAASAFIGSAAAVPVSSPLATARPGTAREALARDNIPATRIQVRAGGQQSGVLPRGAQGVLNRVVCDNRSDPQTVYQCEITDISGPTATTVGRKEGDAAVKPPLDDQINQVYDLLGDTYDYYLSMFTDGGGNPYDLTDHIGFRDRNNNSYAPVLSAAVNSCGVPSDGNCARNNAFWLPADNTGVPWNVWFTGGTMQISAGLANLADVIAHEMQHGVTSELAGLVYEGQSGAISESLSDIFGQAVDLYRQAKYPNLPKDDWSIGEGTQWQYLSNESVPYLRSMKDPVGLPAVADPASTFPLYEGQAATCKGWQPDKMSSPCWDTDPKNEDSGGVHSNSGVGNHLAYLLSVGGRFNGRTVAPLGQTNAMRLWWVTLNDMSSKETYYSLSRHMWRGCVALQSSATVQRVLPVGACAKSVAPALQATEVSLRSVAWGSSIPAAVKAGSRIPVRATVSDARRAGVREGLAGQVLVLQRLVGGRWTNLGSATTSASGRAGFYARITQPGSYRFAVTAVAASPLVASKPVTIRVTR